MTVPAATSVAPGTHSPIDGSGVNQPPPQAGGVTPPAVTPPAVPVAPAPEVITMSPDALKKRLDRHLASRLKELGVDSEDDLAARLKVANDLVAQEEDRKRAALTSEERLRADLATSQAALAEARAATDQALFDNHVNALCLRHGISNADYARFLIQQAADRLPAGTQLDSEAFIAERLADARTAAALGVAQPAVPPPIVMTPVMSSAGGFVPPPPTPGAPGPVQSDVFKMDQQAWAQRRQALGIL